MPSFFGLHSGVKKQWLDEIDLAIEHLNMTYSEVLEMGVFERRYFLGKKIERIEQRNKVANKNKLV